MNAAATDLKPELDPLPDRLKVLPIHRGYPVPWFVEWLGGVPEFRCIDRSKWTQAVLQRLCWVCGQYLGRHQAFVVGPMCGINRTSSEPPCHLDCAQWSARNCPFLSKPQMIRRENDMPEGAWTLPQNILHNPGVTLIWITRAPYTLFSDSEGNKLIHMGEPERVEFFALGKPATRAQIDAAIARGIGNLEAAAAAEGAGAVEDLARARDVFAKLYAGLG